MFAIQHPVLLEGQRVRLMPLDNSHFAELLEVGSNPEIWKNISIRGYEKDTLLTHLKSAVLRRSNGEIYPFTIIDKQNGKIIGSTFLHNLFPEHRKLEIGWTWYDPEYWGTGYNTECKLLLLSYCFEKLNTVRVQFQTDERNARSRAAIQKVGGKFEGILRKERIKADGMPRNTVIFSIVDEEWKEVKAMLEGRVNEVFKPIGQGS
jgi:RimJ/RimL family protein N-acetyltransferase